MSDLMWQAADPEIFLAENEAHIWRISLTQKGQVFRLLINLLDESEKQKADNFRFEIDKRNYAAAHGAMRQILSFYLECHPKEIEFGTNGYGKPFLLENKTEVNFNLSHSREWALLALIKGKRIGIDIEWMRPEIVEEQFLTQVFSSLENEILQRLPKNLQAKAFFDCWTRKEAFIKALGKGLSVPLNEFAVSCAPNQTARLLFVNSSLGQTDNWQIEELKVAENYAAAIAIESKHAKLKLYHWECLKNS